MSTTTATPFGVLVATGTVKVGRWDYPAKMDQNGIVVRNTKRDRSGEWVDADAERFVPGTAADFAAIEAELPPVNPLDDAQNPPVDPEDDWGTTGSEFLDTLETLSPLEREIMAMIGRTSGRWDGTGGPTFDFFDDGVVEGSGIWRDHAVDQVGRGVTRAAGRKAIARLEELGLIEVNPELDSPSDDDHWMWLTAKGATAALAVRGDEAPTKLGNGRAAGDGHGSRPGAQTRKPGKSTWKVGDPCPQGDHVLIAELIYVMPSGRKQCKGCRAGYPSNT